MPPAHEHGGISAMVRLPHSPGSARIARHWLVDAVSAAGVAPEVIDDLALVVSELVTNAVRHAAPLPGEVIEVSVSQSVPSPTAPVRLRVTDGGGPTLPTLPTLPSMSRAATACPVTVPTLGGLPVGADAPAPAPLSGGRGLSIVSSVVDDWGVEVDPSGSTTVWAELRSHHGVSGLPA